MVGTPAVRRALCSAPAMCVLGQACQPLFQVRTLSPDRRRLPWSSARLRASCCQGAPSSASTLPGTVAVVADLTVGVCIGLTCWSSSCV